MGLDITFFKCKRSTYNQWKVQHDIWLEELRDLQADIALPEEERDEMLAKLYNNEPQYDYKDVASFRKVNFLLPFFGYENNCEDLEVSRSEVEDLVCACKRVLEDHSLAECILPTESGFFFGSTDYDDIYFRNVKSVEEVFNNISISDDEVLFMNCWW